MPTTEDDILIRTIMSSASGLPEDAAVNDWAFRFLGVGAPTVVDLTALANRVGDFFRLGAVDTDRVGNYISGAISRAVTHEIQAFSISAGGSALLTIPWLGPVAGAGVSLPTECAGVLSFHGDLTGIQEEVGVTRPRARRRGRVYIGPISINAITNAPVPFLAPAFTAAMRSNAVSMYDDLELLNWRWSVWSRANDELYPVVAGWTDNAPDTQRRRGNEANLRSVYTTA